MYILKSLINLYRLHKFRGKFKDTKIINGYFSYKTSGFYSQAGQDSFLYSEFFKQINSDKFTKVIVDVGCNHPEKYSNSYFFEKYLDFECIAVDPLDDYKNSWLNTRPKAKHFCLALGDQDNEMQLEIPQSKNMNQLPLSDLNTDMLSSFCTSKKNKTSYEFSYRKVRVVRSQKFLEEINLKKIGILSLDVEGFEMNVLRGLDFSATEILIAVIENNTPRIYGSDEIRLFMQEKGFIFYARFWGLDDIYINKIFLNKV